MNNDMLAAAIVWAAEEELKEDGRKFKKAAIKYEKTCIKAMAKIPDYNFGAQLHMEGLTADDAVKQLETLDKGVKMFL